MHHILDSCLLCDIASIIWVLETPLSYGTCNWDFYVSLTFSRSLCEWSPFCTPLGIFHFHAYLECFFFGLCRSKFLMKL
jgi:hypothetical protein